MIIPTIHDFSKYACVTPLKSPKSLFSLVNSSLACLHLVILHAPLSSTSSNELPYISDKLFPQEGFFCLMQSDLVLGSCIVTTSTPSSFHTPLAFTATRPLIVSWRSNVQISSSLISNISQTNTTLIIVEGNGKTLLQKSKIENIGSNFAAGAKLTHPSVLHTAFDPTAQSGILECHFIDCACSRSVPAIHLGVTPFHLDVHRNTHNEDQEPVTTTHPTVVFDMSVMTVSSSFTPPGVLLGCEYVLMQFSNNTLNKGTASTSNSFVFSSFSPPPNNLDEDPVCHVCDRSPNAGEPCRYSPAPIRLFHSFVDFTNVSINGLEGGFEMVEGAAFFKSITMNISHTPSLLSTSTSNSDSPPFIYTTQRPSLHMNLNCSGKAKLQFAEDDPGTTWLEKNTQNLWFNLGDCEVVKGNIHKKYTTLYKSSLAKATLTEGFTYAFSSSSSNSASHISPPPVAEATNSACFVTVDLFGDGLYPCNLQVNLSLIGKDRVMQSSRSLDLSLLPTECYCAWHSSTHISLTFRRTELPTDTTATKLKDKRFGIRIIHGPKLTESSKSILIENKLKETTDDAVEKDADRALRIEADKKRESMERELKSESDRKKDEAERKKREQQLRDEERKREEEERKRLEAEERERERKRKQEEKQDPSRKDSQKVVVVVIVCIILVCLVALVVLVCILCIVRSKRRKELEKRRLSGIELIFGEDAEHDMFEESEPGNWIKGTDDQTLPGAESLLEDDTAPLNPTSTILI
ncbi:hypothetical protein BLNAU_399 [Blattamonas nauphoetae]|uniref:Uncharacterized protein n=1 Tax=Blattamonas nauphoetae TaxID=2049346 RepID=A0ABQ9YL50_9EUKA|nr:hypothetical protein BLNAU_399 [Blattamonas nauphoetae]